MRIIALTALFLVTALAGFPAQAGAPPKIFVTPRITPQVIDSTILASRKINILRLRVIQGQYPTPGPTSPRAGGFVPGMSPK
jgi:hypothetical protein